MPVTAKLSKAFYDKFGEEATNELVEWFNKMDATYRTELRELNELNFARFDAKLEQRLAEVKGELLAQLRSLRGDLAALIAKDHSVTLRWMFGFWTATAMAIVLLYVRG